VSKINSCVDLVLKNCQARRVWYTARGAAGNAKRVLARAPNVKGYVLLTLTIDPARFESPEDAYSQVVSSWTDFNSSLRRAFYDGREMSYFRKMELQENGWPHWHLIINLRKLNLSEMQLLTRIWGYGRTDLEFIRDVSALQYVLKYVSKVVETSNDLGLPDWVLDYRTTHGKVIQWVYSLNFYNRSSGSSIVPRGTTDEQPIKRSKESIRERLTRFLHTMEVVALDVVTHQPLAWYKINVATSSNLYLVNLVKRYFAADNSPKWAHPKSPLTKLKTWHHPLQAIIQPRAVYAQLA